MNEILNFRLIDILRPEYILATVFAIGMLAGCGLVWLFTLIDFMHKGDRK